MKNTEVLYGRDEKGPSFMRDGPTKWSIFNFFQLTENYTSDLTFHIVRVNPAQKEL